MHSMHMSFDSSFGIGTLLLVLAVITALVIALYRRAFESVRDRRMWLLISLRCAALFLVVLLIFRPILSSERTETSPGRLVLLLDTSGSMSVPDDPQGTPRLQQARLALQRQLPELSKTFRTELFRFDSRTKRLKEFGDLESLKATGTETRLADGIRGAVLSGRKRRTVGVILFSDGLDNSGRDVVAAVKKLGVPVHTVATGYRRSDNAADLMVRGVECADQLPLDSQARVTALIDARGMKGRVAKVELVEQDRVLSTSSVTLDGHPGVQQVELMFTPKTKGRHEYLVRVPLLSGERIEQNNHHAVSAVVVDSRLRVLYVEGGVRAEYGTLVGRYLAHDPTVQFLALVQTRPGLFVQRTNIPGWKHQGIPSNRKRLESFDVFLIGDLDSRFLGSARMRLIEELVRDGKGLIMTGGDHSFGNGHYAGTPIANVLPIDVTSRRKPVTDPFPLTLTASGHAHPIFSGISAYFDSSQPQADVPSLPSLLGCTSFGPLKPSAETLAVDSRRSGADGPLPVLVVHQYGKGRVAAFAGDTTYRWYMVMRGLNAKSPYIRFWGQLLRWLGGKTETQALEPGLTVNTDKGFYEPGEPVVLEAVLIGKDRRGVNQADIEAALTIGSTEVESKSFDRQSDRAGTYHLQLAPQHPGLYSVTVTARRNGETLGKTRLTIQVGNPSREFDRLSLDEAKLQAIAEATGGRFVHVSRVDRLFDSLVREQRQRRVLMEQPLAIPPLFWVLCIGLVTTEWFLRKKYRLR